MLVQLSPFLTLKFQPGDEGTGFLYEDYLHHQDTLIEGSSLLEALERVRTPRPMAALCQELADHFEEDPADIQPILDDLLDNGILVQPDAIQASLNLQWQMGAAARYLHLATRDYPFLDYSSEAGEALDDQMTQERLQTEAPPPIYKTYPPEYPRIQLPAAEPMHVSVETLFQPASPVNTDWDIDRLSQILYWSFGQIGSHQTHYSEFMRRTSPSGGSRHPTEVYVAVHQVEGIPAGTYHYHSQAHTLTQLSTDTETHAPCTIYLTSRVERTMWRYRFSRAYRVILADAGHLIGTLRFVSRAYQVEWQMQDIQASSIMHHILPDVPDNQKEIPITALYAVR